ncbi:hypothetical protein AWV79_21590 [Cupriavidus sp. UYMMa02A]|nr:hypothetical protein AWV79_21590 [Cupriavidus sp. UYMMa02A]
MRERGREVRAGRIGNIFGIPHLATGDRKPAPTDGFAYRYGYQCRELGGYYGVLACRDTDLALRSSVRDSIPHNRVMDFVAGIKRQKDWNL